MKMQINIGDDVTINAVVIGVTESGNAIIKFKKGDKTLITPNEINTIRSNIIIDGIDHRKGN